MTKREKLFLMRLENRNLLISISARYKQFNGRSSNGRTVASEPTNLGSNPSLPTTSNTIPVGGGFKSDIDDYRWKKGSKEEPETIASIEQKKKQIAPAYSKGAYQYITPGANPSEIGRKL